MFKRRIGPNPHRDVQGSLGAKHCPDVWELDSGDFAVIGIRSTSALLSALPADAGCGPDEEIVVVPRNVLVGAKSSIPNE